MPFGFGRRDPNAPHRPVWERILSGVAGAVVPGGNFLLNQVWNGVDQRRQQDLWNSMISQPGQPGQPGQRPPQYQGGSPGFGFGGYGSWGGGFGGGFGGPGFGSTGNASYGSGQGFGGGLGALAGGTNQYGLPTGPVDLSGPAPNNGLPAPGGGLGSLAQQNNTSAPHHDPTDDWKPSGNIMEYLTQDDPYSARDARLMAMKLQ